MSRMKNFALDEQLARDTLSITDWPLCKVLLRNDANYPWIILVPCRSNITEIYQMSKEEQFQLIEEVSNASKILKAFSKADKINIGTLGNIVSQLHIHIIARYKNDSAWPQPVWGKVPAISYSEAQLQKLLPKLKDCFIPSPTYG
jgi:diadenosine tetraphosphate (Ap4A) HIT family hydrolase